ncbi:MAG TPA: 2OG-Fe(II) oxygenase [Caulobacteraceae bacterium]|jgi:Rps23 Pro-64 3,4-dihydroxylase Tpa1-like proline 4-hydroxylase
MAASPGTLLDARPPHFIVRDALDPASVEALFDYACAREADFAPATVRGPDGKEVVDPSLRRSLQLDDLAQFEPLLRSLVMDRAAELMARLKMSAAEMTSTFETQLVVHGDGAFLGPHIDTATGNRLRPDVRALSGVFYFHRRPVGFSGGELRLFNFTDRSRFLDVAPTHNSLVVFPPWVPHEVRPVSVPSRRFADARFSVSCWVYAQPMRSGGTG